MDIGNTHKNLVKIASVVPEISCRTNRQADALIAIFATALAGEVLTHVSQRLILADSFLKAYTWLRVGLL